jgi:NADPH-dependent 7-cyano-7-deazaguanine reductase QueF
VDEEDQGTVTLEWDVTVETVELHSLADYLTGFSDQQISHEELVRRIKTDVTELGLSNVRVTGEFMTAGMFVAVTDR